MAEFDKYGIKKLFPSVGLEWFNKWDNDKSRKLGKEVEIDPYDSRFRITTGRPDFNCYVKGDGAVRFRSDVPISSVRLWVTGPWTNTEITVYAKKIGLMRDMQIRSRSNHRISGVPYQCVFGNYEVNWNGTDGNVNISVEPMHPIYRKYIVTNPITDFPTNKYVGFKQITRTVADNKVLVEGYFNPSLDDQDKWFKQLEFLFTGTNLTVTTTQKEEQYRQVCIDKGDMVANDLNKSTLWLNPGKQCWLRLNQCTGWNLRYFSVREIAPLNQ